MTNKFFGRWSDYAEMVADFSPHTRDKAEPKVPKGMALEDEIIIAAYGGGSYDGHAIVIFERDGQLFEVNGSHCSCFGLENQWEPELTTWAALAIRRGLLTKNPDYWGEDAFAELTDEAREYLKQKVDQSAQTIASAKCSCGSCQR